jgi:hypothetical protein
MFEIFYRIGSLVFLLFFFGVLSCLYQGNVISDMQSDWASFLHYKFTPICSLFCLFIFMSWSISYPLPDPSFIFLASDIFSTKKCLELVGLYILLQRCPVKYLHQIC